MILTLTPPVVPMRDQIAALERVMFASDAVISIEPRHFFADGLYSREVTLPAGTTAVGHRHAKDHVCVISKGRALVVTEDGTKEIEAPCTMLVPAGRKNCVHAIDETVWTTIHASDATTVDQAEATLICAPEGAVACLS